MVEAAGGEGEGSREGLLDLPDHLLSTIVERLKHWQRSVVALSCKRMRAIVRGTTHKIKVSQRCFCFTASLTTFPFYPWFGTLLTLHQPPSSRKV